MRACHASAPCVPLLARYSSRPRRTLEGGIRGRCELLHTRGLLSSIVTLLLQGRAGSLSRPLSRHVTFGQSEKSQTMFSRGTNPSRPELPSEVTYYRLRQTSISPDSIGAAFATAAIKILKA